MQLLPNGNAGNRETAPEICLDKDSDHEAAFFFGKMARTCSDAAFPAERDGSFAGANGSFFNGAASGFAQSERDVLGFDVEPADVVKPAIVGFTDERIEAAQVMVDRLCQGTICNSCSSFHS